MAEFVEQNLEELVPVFEQLSATQLLSEKEVVSLAALSLFLLRF